MVRSVSTLRFLCTLVLFLVALVVASAPAKADTYAWNGSVNANWATAGNWTLITGTGTLPGSADTATFNAATGIGGAVITTGSIGLTTLLFDTANAAAYTIGGATAGTGQITFADGTTNIVTMNSTVAASQLINANIILGTAVASNSTITNNSTTNTLTFAGNITGGTGGTAAAKTLTLAGAGAITLNGVVTKGGGSSLILQHNATGTVTLSNSASLYDQLFFGGAAGTRTLELGSSTLRVLNAASTGGTTLQTQAGVNAIINGSSGGTWALQSADADNGAANGTTLTINAQVTGAFRYENFVVASGTGITVMANNNNSFTGGLLMSSSVVSVATFGVTGLNSALGTGSTLTLNGGTLRYTGAGEQSNKIIALGGTTATASLDASGTGTLYLTNTAAIAAGAGIKTWTLTGTGSGRIDAIIADNSATNKTSLSKTGTGTWVLGGVNTYTGTTAVTAGRLIIARSATYAGTATVAAGTGLSYAASTDAALTFSGALTITGGGTVIGASIGNTATSSQITVTGAATISNATHSINIYGTPGVSHFAGLATLIAGGASSTLNLATAPTLGTVFNNTDFTVGAFTRTATALQVTTTAATAITTAFWVGGLSGSTNVWAASNGSTASNWATTSGGAVQPLIPGSTADVTISSSSITTAPTATVLGANMGIKSLTIADTANGLGLLNDGFTLTLTPAAGTGLTVNSGVPLATLGSSIALGAAATFTNSSTTPLILNGSVSGAFAITKAGTGALTLGGLNTFTGGVTYSAGSLNLNSPTALGTGTLTVSNPLTLDNTLGQAVTMTANNPITLAAAATTVTFTGSNGALSNLNLGTGAVTLGASTTFTTSNAASNLTLGGAISGATFNIVKQGTGTLTLGGVIGTTTGGLTVSAGTAVIGNTANTFSGQVFVDGASTVLQVNGAASTTTSGPLGFVSSTLFKTVTLTNGGTIRVNSTWNFNALANASQGVVILVGAGGGKIDVPSGVTATLDDGTAAAGTAAGATSTAQYIQNLSGVTSTSLTKTGVGTLALALQNLFNGSISIAAGQVNLTGADSLGTAATTVSVSSGAALSAGAITMTRANPLTLSGTGLASAPVGALTASASTFTWVGAITIASGGATIGGGAGALTLSSTATINGTAGNTTLATGAGALTVNGTINIGSNPNVLTITHGAGRITTAGVISGTGSVQVIATSTGDWADSAAHTYSGGTTLNLNSQVAVGIGSTGSVGAVTNGPFGTGTVIFNGGNLRSGTGGPFTVLNNITVAADTTFYTVTTEKNLILAGPMTLTGNRTLTSTVGTTVAGAFVNITGAIGDGGSNYSLTKAGTGNLVLSGANTYGGGTIVSAGTLIVAGSLANTTPLTVIGGATLALTGNNSANTISPSTLSLGTAAQTAVLALDLGANTAGSDSINASGIATAAGTVNLNLNGLTGYGTSLSYTLITAASGLSGATYALSSVPGGFVPTLTATDTSIVLNLTPATSGNLYWRGAVNTNWGGISGANTNWTTDAAGTTNAGFTPGATNSVIFSATGATGPAISTIIDGNFSINNLQFLSAPTGVSSVAIGTVNTPYTLTIAPSSSSTGITLAQGSGAVTISATLGIGAAQTWSVDSSTPGSGTASSLTISGQVNGSAALTLTTTAGTTPITLASGAVTTTGGVVGNYNGQVTVSAGTIVQGGATNGFWLNAPWVVNGTLQTSGTAAFSQSTGSLVGGNGIVQNGFLATAATLTIGNDNLATATFAGTIQNGNTGTLGITKTGTGVQVFTGTNTYTGATVVNNGTLKAGSLSAFGGGGSALTVTSPGILDLAGFSNTMASIAASTGTITDSSAPGSGGILRITASSATAITGLVSGSVGIQYGNANGSNAFSSNTANTYSGGTYLGVGTNSARFTTAATTVGNGVGVALTSGIFGTGPINIGRANTDQGQIYVTGAATINNPIIYNSILGTDVLGAVRVENTTTATFTGTQTAGLTGITWGAYANNTSILTVTGKITGSGTFTGTITGNAGGNLGAGTIVGTAAGLIIGSSANASNNLTVVLNNASANNDYTGDTFVTARGILQTNAVNQLPSGAGTGNLFVVGTVNMQGNSQATGLLSGAGTIDGISGTPTLTIGANNADGLNFSGVIKNTAGTLTLTKTGTGTQTLSGASTFTGPINVNGGVIAFATSPATSGPLGNSTAVNLNGGGLNYTASGSNALNRSVAIGAGNGTLNVVSSGGTLTVGTVTSSGGNLVKTGPGAVQLTASTTLNGGSSGVVVNSGTLQGGFGTGGIGSINVASGGTLSFQNAAAEVLTLGGTGSLALASGSALTLELGASGTNDSVLYTTATTAGSITLNFVGLGGFGAGTYNLLNLNTGTTGQLAGTSFVLGSAPLGFNYTITNDGTLVSLTTTASSLIYWNNTQGDGSWANVTGNLGSIGSGLGTNFTSDAAGAIDAGHAPLATETVVFSTSTVVGPTITTTLDGNRTIDSLQFNGSGTPAVTSVTIAQGSGGLLTLKPASVSGGIAILTGGGNATISAPVTLDNTLSSTQTWSVADAGSILALSGNVTFGANVNKTGAGTLTLSGANTGSSNINLNAGTLNLNSSGALGSGALNIANGTTLNNSSAGAVILSGNGPTNINGDFSFTGTSSLNLGTGAVTLVGNPIITANAATLTLGGSIGGSSNLTKAGAGSLLLAGSNTYTGTTFITAGMLRITNGSALGTTGNGTTQSGTSALELDGSAGAFTSNEPLSISGGGISNAGALRNIAGNNTYGGTVTMVVQSRINSDSGTLTLNNPTAVSAINLTLVVGGAGNTTISGAIAIGTGGVAMDGTGTLTLSGTNNYTGSTTLSAGTLNITGSITGLAASSALSYGGTAGKTVVNVSGSFNGFITTGANVAGSVAVLNQTAGTITIVPTNGQDQQYLANNGGYGMLNITGGTFNTGRFDGTGSTNGNGSTAVIYVGGTGATLNQNVGDWFLPIRNSGLMSLTVAPGGTFVRSAAVTAQFSITGLSMSATNNVSYGILNVAGGTVDTGTKGINFSQGTFASGTFTSNGFVNVAGGTFLLGLNTAVGAAAGTTNAYYTYAGGTVKATAAMTALIPASTANYIFTSTIFGPITNNNNANPTFNTQVGTSSNFTGGAVFDTNGFAVTYPNVLGDGVGKFGVTQANITIPVTGNSGYVGAPMVQFAAPAAGGVPASGYALLSGDQVSGIVITNPGTYASGETPLITLTGGGGTIAAFNASGITSANQAAGLIKLGAGTLTLSATNTFGGPVDIRGGVLSVATLANGGSPSGLGQSSNAASNVLLNGGVLDYSGTVAAVTDRNFTLAASNGGLGASGTTLGTFAVNTSNITVASNLGAANFVLSGTGTGATGGGTINGVLADGTGTSISLVKLGTGSWTLAGSTDNTYTGSTTVTGSGGTTGALILAKTGGALAVPGNLVVGNGTTGQAHVLFSGGNNQIAPASTVTLTGANGNWAYLQLQGTTQTFNNLVETTAGFGVIETKEAQTGAFGTSNFVWNVASGTQSYQGYFRDIASGAVDATNSLKLTKTGAGTLQWGAALGTGAAGTGAGGHGYSGGTDIQNGTLQLLAANTASAISIVGAGNVSLNGGATFAGTLDLNGLNAGITGLDGVTGTVLGQVVNNATGTVAVLSIGNNNNNGAFAGLIANNTSGTGTVGINKVGTGTQVLSGANTYTGTTTLTAGTLNVGSVETPGTSGPLGNQLANAAGSIVLIGGTLQYSAANQFDYSGRFSTAINQQYRGDTNGQNVTWAANLVSAGGTLVKSGTGTLTISGTNTYTGATTVSAGTLAVSGATSTGSGTITVGSAATGTLSVLTGGSLTTTGTLTLGSGIIGNLFTVATGGAASVGSISNPWGTNYTIDGTLTSAGTWTISTNNTNTVGGAGTITAPALTFSNASTNITYNGTGIVNIAGAVTVASNSGTGNAVYTQGGGTLNAVSILLGDGTTNTTGTRTFNLTGGRVNVGSGGIASTGTTTATRTVNLGAGTLGASADWSSSLAMILTAATTPTVNTLDSVDNTTARSITLSGALSGSGSLAKAGAGTLTLSSASSSYTGNLDVQGGTLLATAGNNTANAVIGSLGNPQTAGRTISAGSAGTLNFGANDVLGNASSTPVVKLVANGGVITNNGNFYNTLGPVDLNGGTLSSVGGANATFQSFLLTGTVTVGGTAVSTISSTGTNSAIQLRTAGTTFNVADAVVGSGSDLNVTGVLANPSAGTGALIKDGVGTMTLGGLNTFGGAVTVNGGILAGTVAASGGNSAFGASNNTRTITVNAVGTLRFDAGNVFSTNFSSNAVPSLNVVGGTVTNASTATNNALGNVTLAGGTLAATAGSATGYGSFNLNGTVTSTGTSLISSTAPVPITLSANTAGNNNVTTFDVQSGTLTASAALGQVTATGDERISGLTKIGTGTLLLTGANPYSGNTTVSAGTLALGGTGSIAASPAITLAAAGTLSTSAVTGGANSVGGQFALAAGQTLTGTGTVSGPITVATSSTMTPGPTTGSLTLTAGVTTQANSTLTFGIFDGTTVAAAITTGGSSLPSATNPAASNNFLNVTGGTTTIHAGTLIVINAGTTTFTSNGLYSYTVATGVGDQSATNINNQSQFVFNSTGGAFTGTNYSLTGDNGNLYVNFTAIAVPEPATILGLAAAGLGMAGWIRRRRNAKAIG